MPQFKITGYKNVAHEIAEFTIEAVDMKDAIAQMEYQVSDSVLEYGEPFSEMVHVDIVDSAGNHESVEAEYEIL